MPDSAARLLSLLSLLQTPRDWAGSELAQRLGVTGRTVRRDVDRLRSLGYPVEATLGGQGGYRLVAGAALPPLLLEDDEAVAVALGLRVAAGQAVAGLDEAALRALTKLTRVLPSRLRHRVHILSSSTTVLAHSAAPIDTDVLTGLAAAVANHERLRMDYVTRDDRSQPRHVEPVRLVASGRRWYLIAFDLDRADWRTFRVDRIAHPRPTGGRSIHREVPDGDVDAHLARERAELAPTYRAHATLHLPETDARAQLADQLVDGTLTAIDTDRCHWTSPPDTLDWLTLNLLRLGCPFQVHGPPQLVTHLRGAAARIRAGTTPTTTAGPTSTTSRSR